METKAVIKKTEYCYSLKKYLINPLRCNLQQKLMLMIFYKYIKKLTLPQKIEKHQKDSKVIFDDNSASTFLPLLPQKYLFCYVKNADKLKSLFFAESSLILVIKQICINLMLVLIKKIKFNILIKGLLRNTRQLSFYFAKNVSQLHQIGIKITNQNSLIIYE